MNAFLDMSLLTTVLVSAVVVGLGIVISIVITKIRKSNKKEK